MVDPDVARLCSGNKNQWTKSTTILSQILNVPHIGFLVDRRSSLLPIPKRASPVSLASGM